MLEVIVDVEAKEGGAAETAETVLVSKAVDRDVVVVDPTIVVTVDVRRL